MGIFGIVGACGALADFPGDADDAFAAQSSGLLEQFLGQIGRIKNRLRAAFAVADIDENEAAEVAAGVDPTGQSDRLPDMRRAQFVAMMRSFHGLCRIQVPRPLLAQAWDGSPEFKERACCRGSKSF